MAIAPVVIEFMARGMPNIGAAMRSVEQATVRAEQAATRSAQTEAGQRMRLAEKEARDKVRAMVRGDSEASKARQGGMREAERAAQAETRAAQQAAREKIRAMLSADREIARARAAGSKEAERAMQAEARAHERAESEKSRATKKWVSQRESEQKQTREKFANAVVGGAARGVKNVAHGAIGLANGVMNLGGGFSVADSVQREVSLRGQAATLSSSASLAGGRAVGGTEILANARSIANDQGMDPADVIAGISKMKDLTGNLDQAMRMAPQLAKLATATGGDMKEYGELAGNISASSPDMKDEDVERLVRTMAGQGAQGAVEVNDMAKYGARLTAGASSYGMDRTKGIATTSAMAQMARQFGGASSPAEAALAAQRFGSDVTKHADDLEGMGIKVRDGKGTLLDPQTIIKQMLEKTGGDVTKLSGMGMGERGVRVLGGAASIYRDAGGGAKGQKKVDEYFSKMVDAIATDAQIDTAANARLQEVDKQLTIEMNKLKDAVGTQLVPALVPLVQVLHNAIPYVTDLLKSFVSFAGWVEANPLKGAFLILGASITKEITGSIVSAGIGEVIKKLLMSGGGSVPGAASGIPGKLGKGLAVVGAGLVAGELTKEWVDQGFGEESKKTGNVIGHQTEANNLAAAATHGGLTAEQKNRAIQLVSQLRGDKKQIAEDMENPSLVKMVTATVGNVVDAKGTAEATQLEQAEQMRAHAATTAALDNLVTALNAAAAATAKPPPGKPDPKLDQSIVQRN